MTVRVSKKVKVKVKTKIKVKIKTKSLKKNQQTEKESIPVKSLKINKIKTTFPEKIC